MNKESRTLVAREQLVGILNSELARHPEAEGVTVGPVIEQLRFPDEDGCNWSRDLVLQARHRGQVPKDIVSRVLSKVSARYNLS